jgi:hypothetical protein
MAFKIVINKRINRFLDKKDFYYKIAENKRINNFLDKKDLQNDKKLEAFPSKRVNKGFFLSTVSKIQKPKGKIGLS